MGFKPSKLYSRLLEKLLHAKINKGFKSKKEEIEESKAIFKRLAR